jgi:hypothetical protein
MDITECVLDVTDKKVKFAHIFLISGLDGGLWSVSCPKHFTLRERSPSTHCMEGWVGHIISLDKVEKRRVLTLWGLEL